MQVTFNGTGILRTIHPNGRLDESLAQMFHITGSGITSGYLSVQTLMNTAGVNGFVEIAGSDGRVLTTAPISGEGQIQMVFSHVAQGSGYFTGLALFNPGPGDATATIEVDSADGSVVVSKAVTFAAGQRLIGLLSELFPGMQNQLGGSVRVVATQPIYGLQIFGTAGPGGGNFLANIPPGTY